MNLNAWFQGALLAAAVTAVPPVAWAQDANPDETVSFPPCESKPTATDVAAAKGAFQAGKVSFDEADYERAITYWEDAFRRDCTATALLLNLARAYELNNQPRKAVIALRTYLEREPETPDAAPVNRRIEVLKQKISQASAPAPATEEEDQPARKPETPSQTPPPISPPGQQPVGQEQETRPLTPLIVGGAGLVLFVGGGVLYLDAMSDVDHYADVCNIDGARKCADDDTTDSANEARDRTVVTGVISLVGAAAAVGGGIWYLLSEPRAVAAQANPRAIARKGRPSRRGALTVRPAAAYGYAGLQLEGMF